MLEDLDDRFSGNAGKNRTAQLRRNDLVADNEEDVHSADLFDVFLFNAVQPENLREALCACFFLGKHRSRIVAAGLCKAGAAAYRTDISRLNINADGVEAGCVISADRRKDNQEFDHRGVVRAEVRLSRDTERTDIKGMTL